MSAADWGWRERLLARLCAPPPPRPAPAGAGAEAEEPWRPGERLARLGALLPEARPEIFAGKTVIDFGSGRGDLVLDLAAHAREALGLELRPELNAVARRRAAEAGLANARFLLSAEFDPARDRADFIVSTDAMEHFSDPGAILAACAGCLRPGGRMLLTFGPPWCHPAGHHMSYFCRLPWFHLVFAERTVMRVRRLYRDDGAARYGELSGGLGRLTLARFRRVVAASPFRFEAIRLHPIKGLRPLVALPFVAEFFTSVVACVLVLRDDDRERR